jgi:type VI secretion system protein ImpK
MSSPEQKTQDGKESRDFSHRDESLSMLYQGLLTGIVRVQSGRQHISDAESFRKRTQTALQEVERDAVAAGYDGFDVRETHFAVVAFLDSVILNSTEPIRAEWERQTLQEELFGQTDAGVVFFEKLDRLRARRDSQQLADILEVFLLCILLGFGGRYSGGLRGELYSIEDRLKARIEDIRGKTRRLSPAGLAESSIPDVVVQMQPRGPYRLIMLATLAFTVLFYLAATLHLFWVSDQVRSKLW